MKRTIPKRIKSTPEEGREINKFFTRKCTFKTKKDYSRKKKENYMEGWE